MTDKRILRLAHVACVKHEAYIDASGRGRSAWDKKGLCFSVEEFITAYDSSYQEPGDGMLDVDGALRMLKGCPGLTMVDVPNSFRIVQLAPEAESVDKDTLVEQCSTKKLVSVLVDRCLDDIKGLLDCIPTSTLVDALKTRENGAALERAVTDVKLINEAGRRGLLHPPKALSAYPSLDLVGALLDSIQYNSAEELNAKQAPVCRHLVRVWPAGFTDAVVKDDSTRVRTISLLVDGKFIPNPYRPAAPATAEAVTELFNRLVQQGVQADVDLVVVQMIGQIPATVSKWLVTQAPGVLYETLSTQQLRGFAAKRSLLTDKQAVLAGCSVDELVETLCRKTSCYSTANARTLMGAIVPEDLVRCVLEFHSSYPGLKNLLDTPVLKTEVNRIKAEARPKQTPMELIELFLCSTAPTPECWTAIQKLITYAAPAIRQADANSGYRLLHLLSDDELFAQFRFRKLAGKALRSSAAKDLAFALCGNDTCYAGVDLDEALEMLAKQFPSKLVEQLAKIGRPNTSELPRVMLHWAATAHMEAELARRK